MTEGKERELRPDEIPHDLHVPLLLAGRRRTSGTRRTVTILRTLIVSPSTTMITMRLCQPQQAPVATAPGMRSMSHEGAIPSEPR
jgi:hypothetical protein